MKKKMVERHCLSNSRSIVVITQVHVGHVLDCTWNRQLCTWWRDHGYSDVFDAYFRCEGHVKIYHGNCNTPIPEA